MYAILHQINDLHIFIYPHPLLTAKPCVPVFTYTPKNRFNELDQMQAKTFHKNFPQLGSG